MTGSRVAPKPAGVHLEPHPDRENLVICRVVLDPDQLGHAATLKIHRVVHVKDGRPVHGRETIWETKFETTRLEHVFTIHRERFGKGYSYDGREIAIRLVSELEIDDALIFDTKLEGTHGLRVVDRPEVDGDASEIADPTDAFDFFENFKAIPAGAQLVTLLLAVVGGFVILLNVAVGAHDQFVPEAATWLYSHVDSDGDGQSPLMNALMGSGALGAGVWFLMRGQLRRYMTFRFAPLLPPLGRDTVVPAADLVRGRPRVALNGVTFRVVAYNVEKGQYVRGSGTDQRTVSFQTPSRAVVLHEEVLAHVPRGKPIQYALTGAVAFGPLFKSLYPPFSLSKTHGLDVRWEAQILHPDFVDQELVRDVSDLPYEEFLSA